jgi:protein disulfide-isomerase
MAVFVGVFGVATFSKYYTPAERIPWRSDVPAALAEARAANKPVLLYFTAEWCVPCQYMHRNVFPDAALADTIAKSYIPVRIDHDQRADLIAQYQVDGIPWFGVLDANGKPTRILDHAVDTPEQLIAWLKG